MVQLARSDIETTEVFDWQGIHLLHFRGSSCSQKTRIFLRLKGIDWKSHHVDLVRQENYSPWFLGINPRGLVPVLVHDGVVHIESNDILAYLEEQFPEPALLPADRRQEFDRLLREEDDLHLDLRALTMRFLFPKALVQRSQSSLNKYETNGTGTVNGEKDAHREVELAFWSDFGKQGITDEQVGKSVASFRSAYDELEANLEKHAYLAGDELSVVDIAWFIYTARLSETGYPFARVHPKVHQWFEKLRVRPEFAKEIENPLPVRAITGALRLLHRVQGKTLETVAGL